MKLKKLSNKKRNDYKSSFKKLIKYAEKQGLEVECGNGYIDEIAHEYKLIRINTRYRIDQQVFTLAHELGHWFIRKDDKKFKSRYPLRATCKNRRVTYTDRYRFEEIQEEYEAWKKGREILNRLKIPFDEEEFHKTEVSSVMTYIKI